MNELITLKKIEQSKLAIREVKTLDEIKKVVDQTEALKAYAKSAQLSAEIQADIAEINVRATRRLGEISATLERAKPGAKPKELCPADGHNSKTKTLESIGITRQRASEAEKLAEVPEEMFEAKITEAKEIGEKITKSLFDEVQEKQRRIEFGRAKKRVAEYRKTGKKPRDWINGEDDELNKQMDDRDARLEAYYQKQDEKQERQRENSNEQFLKTLHKYLDGLENNDRRAGACNAVIKECRKVLAGLRSGKL